MLLNTQYIDVSSEHSVILLCINWSVSLRFQFLRGNIYKNTEVQSDHVKIKVYFFFVEFETT